MALPRRLGLLHARLERGHEVDDLVLGHHLRRRHDLGLAGRLALDEVEHLVAVGVLEAVGVEVVRQRGDELASHVELLLGQLDVLEVGDLGDLGRLVDLVGVDHRRQHEGAVLRPDCAEVLLRAHHEAGDADLARLLHRLGEQRVGLRGGLVGRHVVGGVVEERIDVGEVDELLDVDRAAGFGVEGGELVVADGDVGTRAELVALDDRLAGHLLAVGGGHLLVLDARAGAGVELVEADGLAGHRGVQLDRDVDQPEADGAAPDGSRHTLEYSRLERSCKRGHR